ncbi:M14 family metallopeptidase [Clostridium tetani]|uniref:M14 family metallopeptidase n=1 Tax=Clostridium tetani TaxID=1513 RepID=UPI0038B3D485
MFNQRRVNKIITTMALTLSLILSSFSQVFAAPYLPNDYNKQPENIIKKHFPKPAGPILTPAFKEGKKDFTSHDEMMEFIYDLQKTSNHMKVSIIGQTQEGKPIPLLIFSNPSYSNAADILKLERPVVWLQGQIHGNEPAGGEGALGVAKNLAGKLGDEVLGKVSVVILPRFNGDGSFYFQRQMASKLDSNRDHLKFDIQETILVHEAFNEFKPEVVIDAHEYSVFGKFKNVGSKGGLVYHDILISSAKNLNIPKDVRKVSDNLFVNNAQKDLASRNFSNYDYYTFTEKGGKPTIFEAGTDPKIGRNAYGLQPSFSFLVESRGIGIGKENFERRVLSHIVSTQNIIRSTANNADLVKKTIDNARKEITKLGKTVDPNDKLVLRDLHKKVANDKLDIIDIGTGEKVKLDVEVFSSKEAIPTLERVRPTAYILPPAYHEVAKRLSYSGVVVRKLNKDMELPVEAYKVKDKKIDTNYYEGHLRNDVTVDVNKKNAAFPKGSYVFTMDQPNANLIAMCLEPDAEDSFVKFNIIPAEINNELPVYRYVENKSIDAKIIK